MAIDSNPLMVPRDRSREISARTHLVLAALALAEMAGCGGKVQESVGGSADAGVASAAGASFASELDANVTRETGTPEDAARMSACDPTSCAGCCSTTGQCLAGTAGSACGSGGYACITCPSGACSGGMCISTVVLFGGQTASGTDLNDTWSFDATSWTQVSVSNSPPARAWATMATIGGEVVLFGGETTGNVFLNDTWTLYDTSWTEVSVSNPPAVRWQAAMATRLGDNMFMGNEVVLSGGDGSSGYLSDTWTFNGTVNDAATIWIQQSGVSNSPRQRAEASMATHGGQVVLFGGLAGTTALNDTWTFDVSWGQVSVSSPPLARYGATMASLDNAVVLFGGEDDAGILLNDTWTFDGTSWTQVSVSSSPPAREGATMATLGSEVVLFGGEGTTGFLTDTWTFDGTSWTQVFVSNSPPARVGAGMATRP